MTFTAFYRLVTKEILNISSSISLPKNWLLYLFGMKTNTIIEEGTVIETTGAKIHWMYDEKMVKPTTHRGIRHRHTKLISV